MRVANLEEKDFAAVRAMHEAQGIDYRLPALDSPLLIVRKTVRDERGKVVGACLLRLTAETMLILAPEMHAREKMDAIEALQPEVEAAAWAMGLNEIEARIEVTTEEIFRKRLLQLGWVPDRDNWHPWTKTLCDQP